MERLSPGKTGAKRQSWEKYNLRELLRDAIKDNPRASEAEIADVVWDTVKNERGYIWPLFEYWFTNTYKRYFIEEVSEHETVLHEVKKTRTNGDERNNDRYENRNTLNNVKKQLKAVLMDHVLSNGKLLREATFRDCQIEGGWFKEIAKQGKPNEIVGKKLTEKDLCSLLTRAKNK